MAVRTFVEAEAPGAHERDTAYHEAGHIAVALHLQTVPFGSTIVPTDTTTGAVFFLWLPRDGMDHVEGWKDLARLGRDLRNEAMILLAGMAVDRHRQRRLVNWDSDLDRVRLALTALHGNAARVNEEFAIVFAETRAIVETPDVWRGIEFIAGELLRRRQLEGMKMLRMVLRAVRIIRGEGFALEEVRSWNGYASLAESAGRDPLIRLTPADFLPLLWIPAAFAAVLLMHALID